MRHTCVHRPASLLVLLLLVAACGTASPSTTREASSPRPAPSPETGCDGKPAPPREAGFVSVAADGTERYRLTLPPAGPDDPPQAAPVEDDERVYLVAADVLRAVDRDSGEPVWELPVAGPVYGMWLDGGRVVLLLDQVSDAARAIGVDAESGEQDWRYDVPGAGLLGEQVLTGDGGLAWIAAGATEVLDLRSGQLRWQADGPDQDAAIAAAGGLVLRGVGAGVTAYDARTGDVRWTAAGLTDRVQLHVVGDVLVVGQGAVGQGYDGSVDAVRLATGERLWEVAEREPLGIGGAGPGGVLLHTQTSGTPTLRLVDPATGRTSWSATTQLAAHLPVVVRRDLVATVEGGTSTQATTELVARRTADGTVAWRVAVDGGEGPVEVGDDVLVLDGGPPGQVATAYDRRTGAQRWQTRVPGFVNHPAGSPRGALLQSADPRTACVEVG